ncbi:endopeptidase La [Geothrix sp. PMB-07]|uniref:endopeptidase La n=1 Tax=Geothrix sp. PMB-07 TaxID=3068640 RepID=UPI00274122EC|nr:endopeptidase La [Geothrix sp. PMB-07]WLT32383.1 endopeptidase La [Geothrix sp. PMB-07]
MAVPKTLTLPAIPIRDMVLFPGARVPFVVGRSASVKTLELAIKAGDHLLMLTQKDAKVEAPGQDDLYAIGTLALVESVIALPKDYYKVGVKGIARVNLRRYDDTGDVIQAEAYLLPEPAAVVAGTLQPFHQAVEAFLGRNSDASRLLSLDQIRELPLGKAIDTVAGLVPAEVKQKQDILEQVDIEPRLDALMRLLELDAARSEVDRTLDEKTRQRLDQDHKQYVLNEKMRVIQQELGKKEEKDESTRLKDQIEAAGMSAEAKAKALEELERLEAMPPQSAEATVSRTYLDWLLALPWKAMAEERLELTEAERVLDEDHSGLEKIKARILEHLAVMARLRNIPPLPGEEGQRAPLRGPILCLVGPPGVGKTSLARSIARALNRPFVRLSLGGVRDEAEIRGHRRTYIGSMPGRIISLMKKAKVRNPLMLLDEIDKMASDFRGDPSSALLEVLDPEQNGSFQDHYLDVGFDLSQVLFLATANVRHQIPEPLEDRLEVLELSGYTTKEKLAIAEKHLIPRALEGHGMKNMGVRFEKAALEKLVQAYTREAGVRQFEREIANILRKLARHTLQPEKGDAFDPIITVDRVPKLLGPEKILETRAEDTAPPGLVNGLAWTPTGGDLLTIEAAVLPGKGVLKLTGKLGEVMQESANLALSYVRARAERLGLKRDFLDSVDLHVHVPEGAIPKDGPSAGITLATALISVLTGIPARADLAMTGELTLRGRVLPIGGLKEKLLAAHRQGRKAVLIPSENARHLEEVPAEVREQLSIHLVGHMDEVIQLALTRMPEPLGPEAGVPPSETAVHTNPAREKSANPQ